MTTFVLIAESRGERGAPRRRHREVVYITDNQAEADRDASELTSSARRYYVMTYDQVKKVAPAELAEYEHAREEGAHNGSEG